MGCKHSIPEASPRRPHDLVTATTPAPLDDDTCSSSPAASPLSLVALEVAVSAACTDLQTPSSSVPSEQPENPPRLPAPSVPLSHPPRGHPSLSTPDASSTQILLPLSTPRSGRDVVEVASARKVKDSSGQKRINQYLMLEVLGKGTYGKVRRCIDETTGDVRAVKILKKSFLKRKRIGRFGNALQNVQREIAVWKKLDHPNVVVLFEAGFSVDSSCTILLATVLLSCFSSQVIDDAALDKLYLVSEFVDGGSLMRDEKTGDPLPLPKVRHYMQQLLSAVSYLHFMRVVHRDIKPGNILIAKDGTLKVTDFGVSQVLEASSADELRSTAGTAAFQVWLIIKQPIYVRYCFLTPILVSPTSILQAPEMLTGGSFSGMKADMWACGMTLYMCIHGRPAYMVGIRRSCVHSSSGCHFA
jgi:hypothetical protein